MRIVFGFLNRRGRGGYTKGTEIFYISIFSSVSSVVNSVFSVLKKGGTVACLRCLLFLLLAGVTVWGNYGHLSSYVRAVRRDAPDWQGRPYSSGGPHVNDARDALRHLPDGAKLVLLTDTRKGLSPVGRILHIGLSWAASPRRVEIADTVEGLDDAAFVLISEYARPLFREPPDDYTLVARTGSAALWRKGAPASAQEASARVLPVPLWREVIGLFVPVMVVAGGMLIAGWTGALLGVFLFTLGMVMPPVLGMRPSPWFVVALVGTALFLIRRWRLGEDAVALPRTAGMPCAMPHGPRLRPRGPLLSTARCCAPWAARRAHGVPCRYFQLLIAVGACVVLGVMATVALGHTFFAPNGLGVYGGKAKLLYLAQGIPPGFFTDPARATLQPAYPPGFALLTLGCYGLAGGCGEYLTQLTGCLFMTLVAVFLMCRTCSWAGALWVVAAFFTPQVVQTGTLYYAEPLMALMALVGWERLRDGDNDFTGWLLLGAAGWIKNEGVLILPACWFVTRVFRGRSSASFMGLLAGLAVPIAWHVGCRMAGGGLYDYGALWQLDGRQALLAAGRIVRLAFRTPWLFGCVYPLAVLGWFLPSMRTRTFAIASATAFLLLVSFVGIFAISRAGDFDWHLASLERLLWMPALLLVREMINNL